MNDYGLQSTGTHVLNDLQLTLDAIGLTPSAAGFLGQSRYFNFMLTY